MYNTRHKYNSNELYVSSEFDHGRRNGNHHNHNQKPGWIGSLESGSRFVEFTSRLLLEACCKIYRLFFLSLTPFFDSLQRGVAGRFENHISSPIHVIVYMKYMKWLRIPFSKNPLPNLVNLVIVILR